MERGSSPPEHPGPERPAEPQAPASAGPQAPPAYTGPVPPGGWQEPIARPAAAWAGRPLASWGSRLGATIIDLLILLIPLVLVTVLVFVGLVDSDSSTLAVIGASLLFLLLVALVVLLYAPLLMMREGQRNGQTYGKQMLGIRVIRDSGEPMSFGWAALREVVIKQLAVGFASSIIPFIPFFLNYFWPLWDDQNRALHDFVASTHVVKG
jgi:uncharacterized RDD family membrane protein YckC